MKRTHGFTLIELLIVVAIIGIIVTIAIPNLLSAIQKAKQKRAMGEIKGMATACNSYAIDLNRYPAGNTSWTDSRTVIGFGELAPYYIKDVPNPDPWNHSYEYAVTPDAQSFGVRSKGMDGVGDSGTLTTLLNQPLIQTSCFENDIAWVNGSFLIVPRGKQKHCT